LKAEGNRGGRKEATAASGNSTNISKRERIEKKQMPSEKEGKRQTRAKAVHPKKKKNPLPIIRPLE